MRTAQVHAREYAITLLWPALIHIRVIDSTHMTKAFGRAHVNPYALLGTAPLLASIGALLDSCSLRHRRLAITNSLSRLPVLPTGQEGMLNSPYRYPQPPGVASGGPSWTGGSPMGALLPSEVLPQRPTLQVRFSDRLGCMPKWLRVDQRGLLRFPLLQGEWIGRTRPWKDSQGSSSPGSGHPQDTEDLCRDLSGVLRRNPKLH